MIRRMNGLQSYILSLLFSIMIPTVLVNCTVRPSSVENQKVVGKEMGENDSSQEEAEALLRSVKDSDSATARRLLSNSVSPNVRDASNITPLMIAAVRGDNEMAEILLNAGADINAISDTGDTALVKAINFEETEVVKLLLKNGADPELRNPYSGESVLHSTARTANVEVMRILLSKNINVNVKDNSGTTPLLVAASSSSELKSKVEIIRALIDKGADVNATNNSGRTALMSSISSAETINILIEHGANVNARDADEWTALEIALLQGCPDIIEILEKAGAQE